MVIRIERPRSDQRPFWRKRPVFSSYVGCILALILIMLLLFYHDYQSQAFYNNMNNSNNNNEHIHSASHSHAHGVAHDALDKATDNEDIIEYDNDGTLHQHKIHNHNHNNNQIQHTKIKDKPWGQIYDPVRVWCVVPTLWPKKKFTMEAIATTWGRHCDQLIFVIDDLVDAPDTLYNATLLKLSFEHRQSTKDRNIWEKVWKMWYHIGKHHLYSAEWFLKIDDDTFFSAINFKGFVRYYNPDNTWYFGHTLLHIWRSKNIVFNSGTCYALSRGSLEKLHNIFNTEAFLNDPQRRQRGKHYCVHRAGAEEDPTMGLCLRSLGINPTNSLDNQYRERFLPFRPGDHEKIEREGTWFWQYKHPKIGTKENCCCDNPVSFHNYKIDPQKQFAQLDAKYNVPEGVNGKKFEIPNEPSLFLYGNIPFEIDEYRNTGNPPAGQRIYKGPGKERYCHNCERFDFK